MKITVPLFVNTEDDMVPFIFAVADALTIKFVMETLPLTVVVALFPNVILEELAAETAPFKVPPFRRTAKEFDVRRIEKVLPVIVPVFVIVVTDEESIPIPVPLLDVPLIVPELVIL